MKTKQQMQSRKEQATAPKSTEELWLARDIEPEQLIKFDPLDITYKMIEMAESPELANYWIARIKIPSNV